MNICEATKNGNALCLGKQGEYGKTFEFDYSEWIERFGEGSIGWMIRRPQDEDGYLVPHTEENGISTFVLTEADTQYVGRVEIEVFYVNSGQTQKRISQTFIAMVFPSMQNLEDVPEPWQPYVDAVHADAVSAQESASAAADSALEAKGYADDAEASAQGAAEAAQSVLDLTADASVTNTVGTPSVSVEVTEEGGHKNMSFAFVNLKGNKGDTGNTGNGISSVTLNNDYTLTIAFTDGTSQTVGPIRGATGNGIASVAKTATVGNVDTYTITFTDGNTTTFDVTNGSVTSVNGRTGAVTGLAEEDGYYEEMSVGGAEQLLSNMYETDAVPYKFRTSGGSLEIGDREYDEIVGGSLVVNQLVENGNFTTKSYWGTNGTGFGTFAVSDNIATLTVGASSVGNPSSYFRNSSPTAKIVKDHVYLSVVSVNPSRTTKIRYMYPEYASGVMAIDVVAGSWTTVASVIKCITDANGAVFYYNTNLVMQENDTILWKNAMSIDLTAMFGTSIADYIYNLEQATTGAGVAWVQKYIGTGYHPYSANTLTHVSGLSKHEMTGFNQWDEEWELGTINSTGGDSASTTKIRSKNYIPVVPSTVYYNKGYALAIFFYDENKNYIFHDSYPVGTFTTPVNCCYIRFTRTATTYDHDICINFHWDGEKDGEYEPYEKHTYALDSSLTLRGVPKQDESGNLYFDGDRYRSDGTVERRYQEVLVDGGVNGRAFVNAWGATDNGYAVYINVGLGKRTANSLSDKFVVSFLGKDTMPLYSFGGGSGALETWTFILPSTVTTLAEANTWASNNPFTILIPLGTPTTESAEPYTSPQWVNNWGTEEYVSATIVPIGHETRYIPDLKAKLETMADSPSGNGTYVLQQTSGINEYVPLVIPSELPTNPSADGTYVLKATVSDGNTVLTWETQS